MLLVELELEVVVVGSVGEVVFPIVLVTVRLIVTIEEKQLLMVVPEGMSEVGIKRGIAPNVAEVADILSANTI
ncbi:hypothetical protein [Photobacterium sp. TLY01]|uniref:hypothetical protein n=1 Tax=Photobacterium sp. TLY01 TaxID=2907534 RepID=UPI001F171623|nr:hypothetical protein [Photobacterium sp. TLY01]UIP28078.1 hypothetical protein LN341_00670 [Photobacterium sp. TLY01]